MDSLIAQPVYKSTCSAYREPSELRPHIIHRHMVKFTTTRNHSRCKVEDSLKTTFLYLPHRINYCQTENRTWGTTYTPSRFFTAGSTTTVSPPITICIGEGWRRRRRCRVPNTTSCVLLAFIFNPLTTNQRQSDSIESRTVRITDRVKVVGIASDSQLNVVCVLYQFSFANEIGHLVDKYYTEEERPKHES